ncbi:hypothetical protein H5410_059193 [Solanum commersonii]|uniref:Uncharacterized protein n=1 Tax=Solanum commersonii TaxID=4109 RepID=A0A9J5W1P0_SOLCO|nr:hypothetical protein H5410_059193 [Solanum commersonii]
MNMKEKATTPWLQTRLADDAIPGLPAKIRVSFSPHSKVAIPERSNHHHSLHSDVRTDVIKRSEQNLIVFQTQSTRGPHCMQKREPQLQAILEFAKPRYGSDLNAPFVSPGLSVPLTTLEHTEGFSSFRFRTLQVLGRPVGLVGIEAQICKKGEKSHGSKRTSCM